MTTPDELVEIGARAARENGAWSVQDADVYWHKIARAVLDAVLPRVREDERERVGVISMSPHPETGQEETQTPLQP